MLFVGLGNPDHKYHDTRHNAGFLVLDKFAKRHQFNEFYADKKANAFVLETTLYNQSLFLSKPQTYMNNSGAAVKTLLAKHSIGEQNLLVIHDDVDLPFGAIKISLASGAGGHKGVASIMRELGTQNFARLRIGIQPEFGKPEKVEQFVLQSFSQNEQQALEQVMDRACDALDSILQEGPEQTMNKHNKKTSQRNSSVDSL